jgi:hypothetical protein
VSGTKTGALRAQETMRRKLGGEAGVLAFFKRIGSVGGSAKGTKGFARMVANGQREKVRAAGRKGGSIGRRGATVRFCTVPACNYMHKAKGLCPNHYEKMRRRERKANANK